MLSVGIAEGGNELDFCFSEESPSALSACARPDVGWQGYQAGGGAGHGDG